MHRDDVGKLDKSDRSHLTAHEFMRFGWIAVANDNKVPHIFKTSLLNQTVDVDPAKSLFMFLQDLWFDLETHKLHPGYDIRSYTSAILGTILPVEDEHINPQQDP